jgi:CcmD family protein
MDPILEEIYSTVLPAAPYVIAAYALIFLILLVYVVYVMTHLKNTEKRLDALEEYVMEQRGGALTEPDESDDED